MNILIVSQRYWPENFRITDIANSLVEMGHNVTVLTGLPNYPRGKIFPEYQKGMRRTEYHEGVTIRRAYEVPRGNNILFRILNYYSFPFFGNSLVKKLNSRFDVVLANELSPIMGCDPALTYKKKFNARLVMYEMDLWPQSLLAGGIKSGSFIYNHYAKISGRIYSGCDKILVSTKEHIEEIKKLPGCSQLDIEYLPQYAEEQFETVKKSDRADKKIHLLFAGNIGKAQSVKTIIETANLLKNKDGFIFDIVGGGSELGKVKALASSYELTNVIFHGIHSIVDMPKFYNTADIMLVTLERQPFAEMTIPGKVQSYMAAGKSIIVSADGATANLIRESQSGIAVPAESPNAFAEAILAMNFKKIDEFGENAKKYYQKNFQKHKFMDRLVATLSQFAK